MSTKNEETVSTRRRTPFGTGRSRLQLEWVKTGIDTRIEATEGPMHRGGYGRTLIEQVLPYTLKAMTSYALGTARLDCAEGLEK
ncbi:hypothetical protein [Aureimonas leprariae]|uniref:Uncharacterized protein n=1 Tax=Plantimonas leprariae TaxID=2615207 RepID=A0A7V7PKJ0_9HYPH|nr:hypothetical protein [Aureimonas leprariae]KAB0676193.1 hypothetical protein F6X38_21865 [Aureimonas leprariae]